MADKPEEAGQFETREDAGKGDAGAWRLWMAALDLAGKEEQTWHRVFVAEPPSYIRLGRRVVHRRGLRLHRRVQDVEPSRLAGDLVAVVTIPLDRVERVLLAPRLLLSF